MLLLCSPVCSRIGNLLIRSARKLSFRIRVLYILYHYANIAPFCEHMRRGRHARNRRRRRRHAAIYNCWDPKLVLFTHECVLSSGFRRRQERERTGDLRTVFFRVRHVCRAHFIVSPNFVKGTHARMLSMSSKCSVAMELGACTIASSRSCPRITSPCIRYMFQTYLTSSFSHTTRLQSRGAGAVHRRSRISH